MSEYQYYEFCRINDPISSVAKEVMQSLSSRARISTHGAAYVYNYGDFCGDPTELLLEFFDVFFYISNWGSIQLMFKYPRKQLDINAIKKYYVDDVISCEQYGQQILLDVCLGNEDGGTWIEGEGLLSDLLPLYEEIKAKNYQFLALVLAINDKFSGEESNVLSTILAETQLSTAQQAFLDSAGIE